MEQKRARICLVRILVTGGMGFIGCNFIHFLLRRNDQPYEIVNLDALTNGSNPKNLSDVSGLAGYRFVNGWTTDNLVVEPLIGEVDVVANFAAETHVDRSISNPKAFFESNAVGTTTLLEHARKVDLKFVQISTDEVYGSASGGYRFRENDKLTPSSPYAASKAAADLMVESYHKTYGLHTVILRCTNNFGPNQFPEKFIPKTIICSILDRKVPIYGDGSQIRDWIFVRDFCRAIELAMNAGESGSTYNVSAYNEISNLEVAKRILKQVNKSESLLQFVEDRPAHDVRYSLDSTKTRNELGWQATTTLDEGLTEAIGWYSKNEDWWKPLISDRILSPAPWKEKWGK